MKTFPLPATLGVASQDRLQVIEGLSIRHILIVASDQHLRMLLRHWLEARAFDVYEATDIEHAIEALSHQSKFSAVICHRYLSDGDGVQFMYWLRRKIITMPFLLLTHWEKLIVKPRWGFSCLVAPFDALSLYEGLDSLIDERLPDSETRLPERKAS